MPSSQPNAADPIANSVACPQLLTPPPESDEEVDTQRLAGGRRESVEDGNMDYGASDNTAHGMAYQQEMSLYINPRDASPQAVAVIQDEGEKEKPTIYEGANALEREAGDCQRPVDTSEERETGTLPSLTAIGTSDGDVTRNRDVDSENGSRSRSQTHHSDATSENGTDSTIPCEHMSQSQPSSPTTQISDKPTQAQSTTYPSTPFWDFTHIRQPPHYPSSLLRPGSKFTGTQQSDRQIYNVDVDILTVDTSQSSLTGYLRICGLTEDHPTLTTFFSGEIIGGPSHRYSFRTRTPTWGATDKTDLVHWARFPAWRSLSKEAKRDIDFEYPLDGGAWWQQENVYMRWKEHFLVPDHRVRSIAGASFEGFYYATFNQVEGQISGIYFHAKSER